MSTFLDEVWHSSVLVLRKSFKFFSNENRTRKIEGNGFLIIENYRFCLIVCLFAPATLLTIVCIFVSPPHSSTAIHSRCEVVQRQVKWTKRFTSEPNKTKKRNNLSYLKFILHRMIAEAEVINKSNATPQSHPFFFVMHSEWQGGCNDFAIPWRRPMRALKIIRRQSTMN